MDHSSNQHQALPHWALAESQRVKRRWSSWERPVGGDQTLNLCLWKSQFPQWGNTGPLSGELQGWKWECYDKGIDVLRERTIWVDMDTFLRTLGSEAVTSLFLLSFSAFLSFLFLTPWLLEMGISSSHLSWGAKCKIQQGSLWSSKDKFHFLWKQNIKVGKAFDRGLHVDCI